MRIENIFTRRKKYVVTKIKREGVKKKLTYKKFQLAATIIQALIFNRSKSCNRLFFRNLSIVFHDIGNIRVGVNQEDDQDQHKFISKPNFDKITV